MAAFSIDQAVQLLKTGDYADLKIVCGNRNFHVHRAIICPQSDFFKACTKAGLKEEAEATIEIKETDPDILAVGLVYLYTNSIDQDVTQQVWENIPWSTEFFRDGVTFMMSQIELYTLADRLLVPSLMRLVARKFCESFREMYNFDHFKQLLERVYEITTSTNEDIRVGATHLAIERATRKTRISSGFNTEGLIQLLIKYEPIAYRVAMWNST
jgi:hypothetical protein